MGFCQCTDEKLFGGLTTGRVCGHCFVKYAALVATLTQCAEYAARNAMWFDATCCAIALASLDVASLKLFPQNDEELFLPLHVKHLARHDYVREKGKREKPTVSSLHSVKTLAM